MLSIQNKAASSRSTHNLQSISEKLRKNYERLSSGRRINSAADDAAGLAISERLRTQIAALSTSSRNTSDGVSLVQTAEGGLGEVSNLISRLREITVQSKNGTLSDSDKETLQNEANEILEQIDQVAESSDFNGVNLLDGSETEVDIDVGGGNSESDSVSVELGSTKVEDLDLDSVDIGPGGDPDDALAKLDAALSSVSRIRTRLGAAENRLSSASNNIAERITQLTSAESRIRDLDVAKESAGLIQNQILQKSGLAIHSQGNLQPQSVLGLLKQ